MIVAMLAALVIVGYLPGALVFRWPSAGRAARAALPAEERAFWAVILSLATSCMLALALAAAGMYTFGRLVGLLIALSLLLAATARGDLRLGPSAARVRPSALVPMLLVAVGLWLYFPPAEWVLGGRDPGVYTNEGVRVAQRGSLDITEPLVAAVPAHLRHVVFSIGADGRLRRFMGFFILDPSAGTVGDQFPQFYPVSLAIGYGLDGLTGVRRATGVWAILGVLAVYFAGTVYFGRAAAAAAAGLLSLHVAQVWFARFPNAEVAFQALLFAALLAYARMETTGSRFFAFVSASLLGVLVFLRVDAFLVLALVAGAVALDVAVGRRVHRMFILPLAGWVAAGTVYLMVFVRPYMDQPIGFIHNLGAWDWVLVAAGACATTVGIALVRRRRAAATAWLPWGIVVAVVAAAAYAYFFRTPGGLLAAHDAYALRTFTTSYLTPYLLAAALAGYALTVPRLFGPHPLVVTLVTGFCVVFFYKIRIVPEHFWMARRFLPVILPAMLLFSGAAVFYTPWRVTGGRAAWLLRARTALGIVMLTVAGWQFFQQTRPILPHVEYAGATARLERLASQIGDDDLVIMESRGASDLHVLAVPLAYIYARNVLVLTSDRHAPAVFDEFVAWAAQHYRRVLYLGSGGRKLLSRKIDAEFISENNFTLPEYDRPQDHPPRGVRQKGFIFDVWRLVIEPPVIERVGVDIGGADDIAVVAGFWAKEANNRFRFRWSTARAEMRLRLPTANSPELTVWLGDWGRPGGVPRGRVSVYVDDQLVGSADVSATDPKPFRFSIPAETLAGARNRDGFVTVRLETPTWSPKRELGTTDNRELGVMVSRVELR